jgi:hypothetical protein
MIKKIAAISALALILTGCVSPQNETTAFAAQTAMHITKNTHIGPAFDSKEFYQKIILTRNQSEINFMIKKLKKTVGKTWYVFSGATPQGWDCSGLTMWAYSQIGIALEHRASKQQYAGKKVNTPKIGDLVTFTYKGYKSAYHVGMYIGNGLMIHAPEKGQVTRIESVNKFAGKYSKISYIRLLDSL